MKVTMPFTRFGSLTIGKENTKVHLLYFKVLNALFVTYIGGRPHVGAVTAALRLSSKKYMKTIRMPGHRDDVITRKSGSLLAGSVKGLVVSLAGIHYDKATSSQIKALVKNSEKLSRQLLIDLRKN